MVGLWSVFDIDFLGGLGGGRRLGGREAPSKRRGVWGAAAPWGKGENTYVCLFVEARYVKKGAE